MIQKNYKFDTSHKALAFIASVAALKGVNLVAVGLSLGYKVVLTIEEDQVVEMEPYINGVSLGMQQAVSFYNYEHRYDKED